jgi:hypothetical protein
MQTARANPTAVAAALVGVSRSGWPGLGYAEEWDNAFYAVYPLPGGDGDEEGANPSANTFTSMLAAANTKGDTRELNGTEGGEGEEKKEGGAQYVVAQIDAEVAAPELTRARSPRYGALDFPKEPTLTPPSWDVFDEELIETIKDEVNEGDWSQFTRLEEISDDNNADYDCRIPSQLLMDYFSQLAKPLITLDEVVLVPAFNTDMRLDVDEDSPMPMLVEDNINRKMKRSRWTVKEARLINEVSAGAKRARERSERNKRLS